jgi:hypothetical protein
VSGADNFFCTLYGQTKKTCYFTEQVFFIADVEAAQVENHKYFLKLSQC